MSEEAWISVSPFSPTNSVLMEKFSVLPFPYVDGHSENIPTLESIHYLLSIPFWETALLPLSGPSRADNYNTSVKICQPQLVKNASVAFSVLCWMM